MNIKTLCLTTCIFLAGCVTTSDYEKSLPVIGSVHSGTFKLQNGRSVTPLPDGQWIVVGTGMYLNNNRTPIEEITLAEIKDDVLVSMIEVRSSITAAKRGFSLSKFCSRDDILFIEQKAAAIGALQECYGVTHYRMTLSKNSAEFRRETMDYMVKNKVEMPINMLASNYHFADQSYFLDAVYFKNPESDGFAPPKHAEWASSDWHKDRIYLDSEKSAYVEQLIKWTEDFEPTVKAGFEGELSS